MHENVVSFTYFDILRPTVTSPADAGVVDTFLYKSDNVQDRLSPEFLDCINKPRLSDWQVGFVLYPAHRSISPPGIYFNKGFMINSATVVEESNFLQA